MMNELELTANWLTVINEWKKDDAIITDVLTKLAEEGFGPSPLWTPIYWMFIKVEDDFLVSILIKELQLQKYNIKLTIKKL